MCRSMVDIQSAAAEIRRGIKKIDRYTEERNHRAKIQCPHLLRRAATTNGGSDEVSFHVAGLAVSER